MQSNAMSAGGGFSMIEVMMATTILLLGFVGLIQAVTLGSESLDTARKQQVANQIVAAEVENLRGGSWTTIANLPSTGTITVSRTGVISGNTTAFALSNHTADPSDDNTELGTLAGGVTCSFSTTRLRPTAATATTVTFMKLVHTVTWTSSTGTVHKYTLDTYLGKNGLHLSYQKS